MVRTDIVVYIFLALVLLVVTSFVIYRTTHVIEQYRGYRNSSTFIKKKKKTKKKIKKAVRKAAENLVTAFTKKNYFNFGWHNYYQRRFYQQQYPDLDQNQFLGVMTHGSHLQDEGGNSWHVYGTRVYDYIKHSETEYDFNVFWRNLYIVPTNEKYRGSLFKYGTGPEDNKIMFADSLDMTIDLRFLKTIPSQIQFRHPALHTTPYTFISLVK